MENVCNPLDIQFFLFLDIQQLPGQAALTTDDECENFVRM